VLSCLAPPAAAADWKGTETTVDGVLQINNPVAPVLSPTNMAPKELWRIGGDDEDEDIFFGVIQAIQTDPSGNVYLLDRQLHQVMILSPDGEFLRTIGREGEGPGEFRHPGDLILLPDGTVGVVQQQPGKIVLLTPEGEPADNFPFPKSEDGATQMFFRCAASDRMVVAGVNQFAQRDGGFAVIFELVGSDFDGNRVATYYENERKHDMAKFEFNEKELGGPAMLWDIGTDGRVYANMSFDEYRVDVWNEDGTPDRTIRRDYKPRKRSSEEKEKAKNGFMVVINGKKAKNVISETDRSVQKLYTRDDGTLWVLSSRGAFDNPEGSVGVFDVYDTAGRFSTQFTIRGDGSIEDDGLFFVGDRLFVITDLVSARRGMFGGGDAEQPEEEPAPMSVICYDLAPELHGMNR
jgi:hypothetical protein